LGISFVVSTAFRGGVGSKFRTRHVHKDKQHRRLVVHYETVVGSKPEPRHALRADSLQILFWDRRCVQGRALEGARFEGARSGVRVRGCAFEDARS